MSPAFLQIIGWFVLAAGGAIVELAKGKSPDDAADAGLERLASERAKSKFQDLRDTES